VRRAIAVDGGTVSIERWPALGTPVVLIHGRGANMRWWHAVTPLLSSVDVTAVDLTGHGESSWRATYTAETWAAEIASVASSVSLGKVILVGHSMGGRVAIAAAARFPEQVMGVVLLDTLVRAEDRPGDRDPRTSRPMRTFATYDAAAAAFRVDRVAVPLGAEVLDPLIEYTVRRRGDSWFLAADPGARDVFSDSGVREDLAEVRVPVHLAYGSHSDLNVDRAFHRMTTLPRTLGHVREIPRAGHQLPLEAHEECALTILSAVAQVER
jgi:pimeloyl-ACP methyl ester carboxylesterase